LFIKETFIRQKAKIERGKDEWREEYKVEVKQEKNLLRELQFHVPLVTQYFYGIARVFDQSKFSTTGKNKV